MRRIISIVVTAIFFVVSGSNLVFAKGGGHGSVGGHGMGSHLTGKGDVPVRAQQEMEEKNESREAEMKEKEVKEKEEVTSESQPGTMPPGLAKQGKTPPGLEKKDKAPKGWEKGKKTGWGK